jgi:hypothetical protein
MEDYKVRDLRASHTLCWSWNWKTKISHARTYRGKKVFFFSFRNGKECDSPGDFRRNESERHSISRGACLVSFAYVSCGSLFKKIESQTWASLFHLRPERVCLGAERFDYFNYYAQGHQGVSKLTFVERGPVTSVDISSWESKHLPCVLPDDLKALLQITDGITLKWDANLHGPRRKNRKCYTHTCNRARTRAHTHTHTHTHNTHLQQLR